MTVIFVAFREIPKGSVNGLEDLKIRGQVKNVNYSINIGQNTEKSRGDLLSNSCKKTISLRWRENSQSKIIINKLLRYIIANNMTEFIEQRLSVTKLASYKRIKIERNKQTKAGWKMRLDKRKCEAMHSY